MAFDFTAALNIQTNPANLSKVNKDIQKSLNKVSLNLDAKNIAKAQGEIKKLQGTLSKTTSVAKQFGDAVSLKAVNFAAYTLASTAVLKLTGAISNATRESLKLQTELAKIAQVTNSSNKEVLDQSNLLKKVSVEYNIASSKVAQLTRTLAQTGLSFQQAAKAAEVLARTSLLATFDSLQSTTEGFIATLSSFSLSVDQAGQSLEAINAVSKRFAVESSDIVEAIRRTGGAFNAAGGNINELIALFTAVRSTSRESAETIATGFRTIFGRLQRPKTIEFFKELGIQLETAEGQFVGPLQAIQNISQGLDRLNISVGSTKFAEVVEQIGGIRQLSRVVPLLTQTTKITEALGVANNGTAESAADVAKAQQTVAFQLGSLQKNFASFIDDVISSPAFQTLSKAIIGIANALVEVGKALTPLIPLFTTLAGIKLGSFIGGGGLGRLAGGAKGLIGLNSGGFVPGSGNSDTVPAMLTPGEFVIRKSAAQAFGAENLQAINKYADGGRIIYDRPQRDGIAEDTLNAGMAKAVNDLAKSMNKDSKQVRGTIKNIPQYESVVGVLFEAALSRASGGKFTDNDDPLKPFDFPTGLKNSYFNLVGRGAMTTDAKKTKPIDSKIKAKIARFLSGDGRKRRPGKKDFGVAIMEQGPDTTSTWSLAELGLTPTGQGGKGRKPSGRKRRNAGGSIPGVGTDTVPALLTPGEFVVNKKSAQAFGYGNLKEVNRYAKGGVVQKFQAGGLVGGLGGGIAGALLGGGGFGGFASELGGFTASLGSSFLTLQVASTTVSSTLQEAAGSIKQTIQARKENAQQIKESAKSLKDLSVSVQKSDERIKATREKGVESAASRATSLGQKKFDRFGAGIEDEAQIKKAQLKLANEIGFATQKYGRGSKELDALNKVQAKFKGDVVAQATAVGKYVNLLEATTKSEQEHNDSLKKQIKAEKERTEELKRGKLGKLKASGQQIAQGADALASVAVAAFSASLNAAAQAADKLADKAVQAGDVQEASAKAEEAASKRAQAASQVQAAAALSGLGTAIGGIFGPVGAAIGSAFGKLLTFIPGVVKGFQFLTDLLGITNSKEEARKARIEAANKALEVWTRNLNKSTSRQLERARSRGASTSEQQSIVASSAEKEAAKLDLEIRKEKAALERSGIDPRFSGRRARASFEKKDLETENLRNFSAFISQFEAQAKSIGGGSREEVLRSSKNLNRAFKALESTLKSRGAKAALEDLRNDTSSLANTVRVQKKNFDATNSEFQLLRLSAGEAINALDIFGEFISEDLEKDLKQAQKLQQQRLKIEEQRIKLTLKAIDTEEQIAQQRASFLGTSTADQQAGRSARDARRVQALVGSGQGAPTNLQQVNQELLATSSAIVGIKTGLEQAAFSGDEEEIKRLSAALTEAQDRSKKLTQAQDILVSSTKAQEEAARQEIKARMESIAALEDFKGGLVEEFAFGTDEQRRDLGRSAALTAQAIQQGGIQNIASEDRGAVKSFLDRLPQNLALDTLGGKTAARVKGEFAADEAIRKGLIGADERESFVKAIEQQGKPVEQRLGEAFEAERKKAEASFDRQEAATLNAIKTQQAAANTFAAAVDAFALSEEDKKKRESQEIQLAQKRAELDRVQDKIRDTRVFARPGDERATIRGDEAVRKLQVIDLKKRGKNEEADRLEKQGKAVRKLLELRNKLEGEVETLKSGLQKPAAAGLPGGVPAGGVPAGGVPAGGVPAGGVPAGGVPAGGVPAGAGPAPVRGGAPTGIPAAGAGAAGVQVPVPGPPQKVEITGTTQVNVNLNGTVLNAVVSQVYTTISQRFTELARAFRDSNTPDDQANAFDNAAGNLPPQPTP
jgi:TP901 family phage tail tape measure protein